MYSSVDDLQCTAVWTTCSVRQCGRPAVYGSVDDLQCTAVWTTFSIRQRGRPSVYGSVDDLQCTPVFSQRTGVSIGVMDENQSSSYTLLLTLLTLLCLPSVYAHSLGHRSSPYAASSVWNSLPGKVKSSNTLISFKSSFKSHLFKLSYLLCVRACVRACVCACVRACV